jgi:hypothetical protein
MSDILHRLVVLQVQRTHKYEVSPVFGRRRFGGHESVVGACEPVDFAGGNGISEHVEFLNRAERSTAGEERWECIHDS